MPKDKKESKRNDESSRLAIEAINSMKSTMIMGIFLLAVILELVVVGPGSHTTMRVAIYAIVVLTIIKGPETVMRVLGHLRELRSG